MSELVAVTTTIDPRGGIYRKPRIALYANYLKPLERVGFTPVLVTPAHGEASIRDLVGHCRGLVLSGGEDIDPSRYGEEPIPELGQVNPARDRAELCALGEAYARDLPILGICRGHQLLNVYFGGSLYQDIEAEMPHASSHLQTTPWGSHHHEVEVVPGSRLARALATEEVRINSYHHQAVRRLGEGLEITARAVDGLVEGIEAVDRRWIVGVQWHPERHEAEADDSNPDVRLFAAFGEAVRETT